MAGTQVGARDGGRRPDRLRRSTPRPVASRAGSVVRAVGPPRLTRPRERLRGARRPRRVPVPSSSRVVRLPGPRLHHTHVRPSPARHECEADAPGAALREVQRAWPVATLGIALLPAPRRGGARRNWAPRRSFSPRVLPPLRPSPFSPSSPFPPPFPLFFPPSVAQCRTDARVAWREQRVAKASRAARVAMRPSRRLMCACVNMPPTVGPGPSGPDTAGKRRANRRQAVLIRPAARSRTRRACSPSGSQRTIVGGAVKALSSGDTSAAPTIEAVPRCDRAGCGVALGHRVTESERRFGLRGTAASAADTLECARAIAAQELDLNHLRIARAGHAHRHGDGPRPPRRPRARAAPAIETSCVVTRTSRVAVSERPSGVVTRSVTTYCPSASYWCGGHASVETVPSRKFHSRSAIPTLAGSNENRRA